jgi:hypothetical protein
MIGDCNNDLTTGRSSRERLAATALNTVAIFLSTL